MKKSNVFPAKKLLSVLIQLLLLSLASSAFANKATVGEPAPFFKLSSIDGLEYQLDDFRGKVVFINFWASWCAPCRKEMPLLNELQEKHNNLAVLTINIDSEKENALAFLEDIKPNTRVLFDGNMEVVSSYGALAMPTSFVVDQQGIVRFIHYGFKMDKDPAKWDEEIKALSGG